MTTTLGALMGGTVDAAAQAQECLRWYCLRWRIEDWHRVLKCGCRIETLQHKTAERLKRAIAIHPVIAWRIMLMTLLGRQCPDLPAEVLFSDAELEMLQAYAKKERITKPTRLGDAVRLVARIGGYIGRAKDPHPGHQIMWQAIRNCNRCAKDSACETGVRMTRILMGKGQG